MPEERQEVAEMSENGTNQHWYDSCQEKHGEPAEVQRQHGGAVVLLICPSCYHA